MLVLLGLLIFVYNLGAGLYLASGLEPHPAFEFLYAAGFACGVVWWLRAEVKRSAVVPLYCEGMLVSLGWLVVIPYHLLKTRGLKGLLPLLFLIGCFVFAYVCAVVAYLFISPEGLRF